jgi:SpoIID/LytB domain protein
MSHSLRLVAVGLGLALLAACAGPRMPEVAHVRLPNAIQVRSGARIVSVPLESYVLASALSEIAPVRQTPAAVARLFDLQTILARTYAISNLDRHRREGFDLCDTTHCQVYDPARLKTSGFAGVAREAVARTQGVLLVFSQRPAEALYHSDCGGHTAAAEAVWGGLRVPYLVGTPDDVPASTHRRWVFEMTDERIREAFNADARSVVGRRLDTVAVVRRDASGRAAQVELRGESTKLVRGEELRAIINRAFGDRAILSTKVSVARERASFRFTGTGFGHGVGLCQVGAAARARRGDALNLILAAYFPGAAVARARSARPAATRNLLGLTDPPF